MNLQLRMGRDSGGSEGQARRRAEVPADRGAGGARRAAARVSGSNPGRCSSGWNARPATALGARSGGAEPWITTLEEFNAGIQRDYDKYAKRVNASGAKVDQTGSRIRKIEVRGVRIYACQG